MPTLNRTELETKKHVHKKKKKITLFIRPYYPSLPVGFTKYILCPNIADGYKFLLVS